MTDTSSCTDPITAVPVETGGIEPFKAAFVIALAALADWLFYGHDIGISAALFLAALGGAAIAANPRRASRRETGAAVAVMVAGFVPMVIQPSFLAAIFGVVGVAYAAMTTTETGTRWTRRLNEAGRLIFDTTWRAPLDLSRALRTQAGKPPRFGSLVGWIVPLGLGTVFLLLFANANPLIESFLSAIDLSRLLAQVNVSRVMLWLLFVALVWPFVFLRRTAVLKTIVKEIVAGNSDVSDIEFPATLLNRAAILRSLVLFNALFAVQTVLDLTYLWGSAALPAGTSHAAYAHRGAYPLIATALLAAAFVIIALKPGSDTERSRPIRLLVFAWIAQNVLLVSSSILRLDLYVEVYSLSYWRLAAIIWMGLVAAGLLLIIARIALGRSNRWLVGMNVAALAVTLYAVNLVNLPAVIANYNVEHSREISGKGSPLDAYYLLSLGPHALPAIDRYVTATATITPPLATVYTVNLRRLHLVRMADWRAWGYFDASLSRYLEK
jgi:hypothetical protein